MRTRDKPIDYVHRIFRTKYARVLSITLLTDVSEPFMKNLMFSVGNRSLKTIHFFFFLLVVSHVQVL